MDVGHGKGSLDDPRQVSDVGHLVPSLVLGHRLHQQLVGEDTTGDSHPTFLWDLPDIRRDLDRMPHTSK